MTVYISADAKNLREELASLRNQGGYQEQQFYFDSLVTNGTFDADTSGWGVGNSAVLSIDTQRLKITNGGSVAGYAKQQVLVEVGKTYTVNMQTIAGTAGSYKRIGTVENGTQIYSDFSNNAVSVSFTATTSSIWIVVGANSTTAGQYAFADNISVYETDGTDVVHRLPKGWKPKDVFEDGLLQREGAAHDYEVVYDGFDYYVKPAVAPSATTQTCVIGVKA
jgi:hypothetical protein